MSKPGDWNCKSCQHLNFFWRQSCQRCQEPRPEGVGGSGGSLGGQVTTFSAFGPWVPNFRPGDWLCGIGTCQAHNFSNRRFCFKCGVLKNVPSFGGNFRPLFPPRGLGFYGRRGGRIGGRGWKPGDWFCSRSECNAHNYGTRVKCFKCSSSRELVGQLISLHLGFMVFLSVKERESCVLDHFAPIISNPILCYVWFGLMVMDFVSTKINYGGYNHNCFLEIEWNYGVIRIFVGLFFIKYVIIVTSAELV